MPDLVLVFFCKKSPMINSSFAEGDLQPKAFYVSWQHCNNTQELKTCIFASLHTCNDMQWHASWATLALTHTCTSHDAYLSTDSERDKTPTTCRLVECALTTDKHIRPLWLCASIQVCNIQPGLASTNTCTCHDDYSVAKTHKMPWVALQVIFCKRATKYRALLRKITCEDKASCGSWPPCTTTVALMHIRLPPLDSLHTASATASATAPQCRQLVQHTVTLSRRARRMNVASLYTCTLDDSLYTCTLDDSRKAYTFHDSCLNPESKCNTTHDVDMQRGLPH